jgi:hypothetical protein
MVMLSLVMVFLVMVCFLFLASDSVPLVMVFLASVFQLLVLNYD